ncbi:hypothetical protein JTE90_022561 [Oedothorax gibbosus]|uniref:Uncharacterized protein n=1 Tax=Oedothorax gibbosus TaxID=931172 RepID=A0AAV6TL47_9ARAC|nr:hypothetical protein JTE90_022561 [Oedothorax gibbosus]
MAAPTNSDHYIIKCTEFHYLKLPRSPALSFTGNSNSFRRWFCSSSSVETGLQLLKEFPEPKRLLWRVINEAYVVNKNSNIKPSLKVQQVEYGEDKQPCGRPH